MVDEIGNHKQELYIAKYQGRCIKLVCKKLGLKTPLVYQRFGRTWKKEYREFKLLMDKYVESGGNLYD